MKTPEAEDKSQHQKEEQKENKDVSEFNFGEENNKSSPSGPGASGSFVRAPSPQKIGGDGDHKSAKSDELHSEDENISRPEQNRTSLNASQSKMASSAEEAKIQVETDT